VLQRFSDRDRETMNVALAEAADGVELWIREGIQAAMNRLNAPASSPKDQSKDNSPAGRPQPEANE